MCLHFGYRYMYLCEEEHFPIKKSHQECFLFASCLTFCCLHIKQVQGRYALLNPVLLGQMPGNYTKIVHLGRLYEL